MATTALRARRVLMILVLIPSGPAYWCGPSPGSVILGNNGMHQSDVESHWG